MNNQFGLDADYFNQKLGLLLRDMRHYTPDELARQLARLSKAADGDVLLEPEFSGAAWTLVATEPPPVGEIVLLAVEFDAPGDWRMKSGQWIPDHPEARDGWIVYGASWTPTHWRHQPMAPDGLPAHLRPHERAALAVARKNRTTEKRT